MPEFDIIKAMEEQDRADINRLEEKVEKNSSDISELRASTAALSVTLGRVDANVTDIGNKLDEQRQKPAKAMDAAMLAAVSAIVGAVLASLGSTH